MSRPISRPAIVRALLKKELKAYSRDTVYLLLTLAVLVLVPLAFRVLPDSVSETITLAVSPPITTMVGDARETLTELGATDEQLVALDDVDLTGGEEGLRLVEFEDEEQMQGVIEGTVEAWKTDDGAFVFRAEDAE
ncbi:MAG: hypothetical protein RBS17_10935, partial [Coriobacteriia bacterium]|nr:hypothetical protein [Coriobacteriia bacterium]